MENSRWSAPWAGDFSKNDPDLSSSPIMQALFICCFQANRDAGIREAECEKCAMDIKYSTGEKRVSEYFIDITKLMKNSEGLLLC